MSIMNGQVKADWIAALRSGEYRQGVGALRKGEEDGQQLYCCLGVLCELAIKARIIPEPMRDDDKNTWSYEGESGLLNSTVMQWAGLTSDNPRVEIGVGADGVSNRRYLSELNDGTDDGTLLQYTFEEIANLIEEQL